MADTVIARRLCALPNVVVGTLVLLQAKQFSLKYETAKRHPTRRGSFGQQIESQFKEGTSKVLHLEHSVLWC
jgi:hypothetical protein